MKRRDAWWGTEWLILLVMVGLVICLVVVVAGY